MKSIKIKYNIELLGLNNIDYYLMRTFLYFNNRYLDT